MEIPEKFEQMCSREQIQVAGRSSTAAPKLVINICSYLAAKI